jgi:hypothetical protein
VFAGRYEDEFVRLNGQCDILHRNNITFIPTLDLAKFGPLEEWDAEARKIR